MSLLTLLQKNSGPHQYPTWARMAQDYLAIQGSATPSERAFSGGGITGTARHSCLTVEMFEALQILKSAYWGGHIMAADDAEMQVPTDAGDWETLVAMEGCANDQDGDIV
jgi:hAT family C-terminal dimerisation region